MGLGPVLVTLIAQLPDPNELRHRRVLSNTIYRSLESIICRLNHLATTRIHVIKNVFRCLK